MANNYLVILITFLLLACHPASDDDWLAKEQQLAQNTLGQFHQSDHQTIHAMSLEQAVSRSLQYDLTLRITTLENKLAAFNILANQPTFPALNFSYSDTSSLFAATGGSLSFVWNLTRIPFFFINQLAHYNQTLANQAKKRLAIWQVFEQIFQLYNFSSTASHLIPQYQALHDQIEKTIIHIDEQPIFKKEPIKALTIQKNLLLLKEQLTNRLVTLQQYIIDLKSKTGLPDHPLPKLEPTIHSIPVLNVVNLVAALDRLALKDNQAIKQMIYEAEAKEWTTYTDLLNDLPALNLSNESVNLNTKQLISDLIGKMTNFNVQITWNLLSIFKISKRLDYANTQNELDEQKVKNLMIQILLNNRLSLLEYLHALQNYQHKLQLHRINHELWHDQNILFDTGRVTKDQRFQAHFEHLEAKFEYTQAYIKIWLSIIKLMRHLNIAQFDTKLDTLSTAFFSFLDNELPIDYLHEKSYKKGTEISLDILTSDHNLLIRQISQDWESLKTSKQSIPKPDPNTNQHSSPPQLNKNPTLKTH